MDEFATFEANVSNTLEQTIDGLLEEWGFPNLIEEFRSKGIDIEVLKELNSEDLIRLIPDESFGIRIKFRKKLYQWQLEQGCRTTTATTTVVDSGVSSLPISITSEPTELTSKSHNSGPSSPFPSTSSASTSEFEKKFTTLDLQRELASTIRGDFILSEYKRNNSLSKTDRQYVVEIVAEHLVSRKRRITSSEYKELSQQIVEIFPTEDEVTYFGSENQRGKLAEKYYTLSKKLMKCGIIEKPIKRKLADCVNTRKPQTQLVTDIKCTEDQENDFLWLQKNFSPESLVVDKWKKTFELRRRHIADATTDILNQWPILKQKIGLSLIEIDFEIAYPQKSTLLFSKWDYFSEKIVNVFNREIKDSYCRQLLNSLSSVRNEDSKNYIITILMNGVLIPQILKRKGSQPWKPTILDAQKTFATHVVDKTYIESTIELRKTQSKEKNSRLQPSIIVVGENPQNITQFFIYFDDILYETENYLRAVSITYQLHFVLGLEYATECGQVWQFIEEYFYEMETSKKRNSTLNALINEIKKPATK